MAGHNKWSKVKRAKAVTDSRKGKVFSRLSRDITLAAKSGGGDPAGNARLRTLLLKARDANMPVENVDRAIKKGTGELPGVVFEEITYEAYGPGGVALIIALGFNALWYWARRGEHLLEPGIPARTMRLFTRQYAVGPLVYLAALGISFVSAWGSLAIFVLVLVFYAIPTPATAPLDAEE